jgi:hypothetical protein
MFEYENCFVEVECTTPGPQRGKMAYVSLWSKSGKPQKDFMMAQAKDIMRRNRSMADFDFDWQRAKVEWVQ